MTRLINTLERLRNGLDENRKGYIAPKYDVDGNLITKSDWQERIEAGYVPPEKRKKDGLGKLPRVSTATGSEKAYLRELAQSYTERALSQLIHIAENGRNEAARVAACNSLLDRGHGKPHQFAESKPDVKATQINVSFGEKHNPLKTIDAESIQVSATEHDIEHPSEDALDDEEPSEEDASADESSTDDA